MLSLVQYYLKAVKQKDYPTVATYLALYPHLTELSIEAKDPLSFAIKGRDDQLFKIFYGLIGKGHFQIRDALAGFNRGQLPSFSKIYSAEPSVVKQEVYQEYDLRNAHMSLPNEMYALHAEQLYLLTGLKPEIVHVENKDNEAYPMSRVLEFRCKADEASIAQVTCALKMLGIDYNDKIVSKDTYNLQVDVANMLKVQHLYETGDISKLKVKAYQTDDFSPYEKVRFFDLCFNVKSVNEEVLSNFLESELYYVYETSDFQKHFNDMQGAAISQFAKGYLTGLLVAPEFIDGDQSQGFEREGSKEILATCLQLPCPNDIAKSLEGLSQAHKEALFEMCFTPKLFIQNFKERIKNDFNADIDSLLMSEVIRYQSALRTHLPEKVEELNVNLNAWHVRNWLRGQQTLQFSQNELQPYLKTEKDALEQSTLKTRLNL